MGGYVDGVEGNGEVVAVGLFESYDVCAGSNVGKFQGVIGSIIIFMRSATIRSGDSPVVFVICAANVFGKDYNLVASTDRCAGVDNEGGWFSSLRPNIISTHHRQDHQQHRHGLSEYI